MKILPKWILIPILNHPQTCQKKHAHKYFLGPLTSLIISTPKPAFHHSLVIIPTLNLYLTPSWTCEIFTQMNIDSFF